MKRNFWIYLSCLLFCAAIFHRIWDHERRGEDCRSLANVFGEYQSSLKSSYLNFTYLLKSNLKKHRSFIVYRDSLTVINYLVDNNKADELMEMCSSKSIDSFAIERSSALPIRIQKYKYANLLLEYYCSITGPEKLNSTVAIQSKVVNYHEVSEVQFEIEFDFYSILGQEVDAIYIYIIDGVYIPDKLGGGATKFPPKKIDVLIKDKVTGERKKYEFDSIKV